MNALLPCFCRLRFWLGLVLAVSGGLGSGVTSAAEKYPAHSRTKDSESLQIDLIPLQRHFLDAAFLSRGYHLALQAIRQEQEGYLNRWNADWADSTRECLQSEHRSFSYQSRVLLGLLESHEAVCQKAQTAVQTANLEFVRYLASRPEPESLLDASFFRTMDSLSESIIKVSVHETPTPDPVLPVLIPVRLNLALLSTESNILTQDLDIRLTFLGAKDLAEFTVEIQKQAADDCLEFRALDQRLICTQTRFIKLWKEELSSRWRDITQETRSELLRTMLRSKANLQSLTQIAPWSCGVIGDTLSLGSQLTLKYHNPQDPYFLLEWSHALTQSGLCQSFH